MNPALMQLIIMGVGMAANAASEKNKETSSVGSASDVTNVNQQNTDQWRTQLEQLLGQYGINTDQFAGQAAGNYNTLGQAGEQTLGQGQTALNQAMVNQAGANVNLGQSFNQINDIGSQLGNLGAYDPNQATSLFQGQVGGFEDIANRARQEALSGFETPAATQAALAADRNVGQAANQFSNLGASTSGAAAAAAAQGAQSPLAQLAAQRAQLGSQAYLGTLNPLLQQGQQNAVNQSQFGYNAQIQNLMSQLGAAQGAGQLSLGQLSGANQSAGIGQGLIGQGFQGIQGAAQGQQGLSALYAGLQGGALQGLNQYNQPEYWQPALQPGTNTFQDMLSGGMTSMFLANQFNSPSSAPGGAA